mmetsp:Transcript_15110/g.37073  ORF Transcript_15110/g.37073 Transcript_15110/m.37073 type:complete len:336 (+) Transcript_15110:1290-2297(+)
MPPEIMEPLVPPRRQVVVGGVGIPLKIHDEGVDGEAAGAEVLQGVLDVAPVAPAPPGGREPEGVLGGDGGAARQGVEFLRPLLQRLRRHEVQIQRSVRAPLHRLPLALVRRREQTPLRRVVGLLHHGQHPVPVRGVVVRYVRRPVRHPGDDPPLRRHLQVVRGPGPPAVELGLLGGGQVEASEGDGGVVPQGGGGVGAAEVGGAGDGAAVRGQDGEDALVVDHEAPGVGGDTCSKLSLHRFVRHIRSLGRHHGSVNGTLAIPCYPHPQRAPAGRQRRRRPGGEGDRHLRGGALLDQHVVSRELCPQLLLEVLVLPQELFQHPGLSRNKPCIQSTQ